MSCVDLGGLCELLLVAFILRHGEGDDKMSNTILGETSASRDVNTLGQVAWVALCGFSKAYPLKL